MADIPIDVVSDAAAAAGSATAGEEPMFGLLDIFLLSISLGIGVYWFFFRGKKKDDDQAIKKLTVV